MWTHDKRSRSSDCSLQLPRDLGLRLAVSTGSSFCRQETFDNVHRPFCYSRGKGASTKQPLTTWNYPAENINSAKTENDLGNNTVSAALSSLLGSGVFSPMPGEIFMISSLLQSSHFDWDLLSWLSPRRQPRADSFLGIDILWPPTTLLRYIEQEEVRVVEPETCSRCPAILDICEW